MKKLLLVTMMALAMNAMAGDKGNGGCSECQTSYDLALELSSQLVQIGDVKVQGKVPLIKNVADLFYTSQNRKVEPGTRRELKGRDALSFSDSKLTKINTKSYKKLAHYRRVKLELHEMLVLMQIEAEGVYVWSNKLSELFINYEKLETQSEGYSCSENECVIRFPKPTIGKESGYIHESSDADGVCKFYNLGSFSESSIGQRLEWRNPCGGSLTCSNLNFNVSKDAFLINKEGNYSKNYQVALINIGYAAYKPSMENFLIYESVTCKRNQE